MSHPPYSFGPSNDPGQQPPADPYQPSGYPPAYPDPTYGDPAYHDPSQQHGYPGNTGYQPTSPYSPQQQYPGGYPGQQPGYPPQQQYPPAQGYPHQQGYGASQPQYPGYPGYPPEPPKGNKTGVIVAVVAVLLVLVVGGGVAAAFAFNHDKKPVAQGTGGPSDTPSVAPSDGGSGTDTGSTHTGDLRSYLVPMPSGAQKCSDEEGTNESLSLDQASKLSSDPENRKKDLESYKFKGGAVRCWVTADNTTVDVRLYQFGETEKAKSFFDSDIEGTSTEYTANNITDVNGVPQGKSFAKPEKDSQGYVRVISIGLNGDVVLVIAIAQLPPLKVSVSETLLQQEYQKL
ncbi:hypothetical protein [Rugosimonospora africana]|uniref:DUF4190 domain-containing protein n=1 Tax=Rugosimonospora africana TaxID=556532 RepID=A0A8J3VWP9_9ACTN|nr:hypothetical protein [Rugosimonospora africana]GIH21144.1 hypothetical protein Raf01_93160 [Rugosimonospora africana]